MTISVKQLETHTLIKVEGHFDTAMLTDVQPLFDELIEKADKNFIIDFSLTTRIDTSGIGVIVFLFKRLCVKQYSLELIGLHGQPLKKLNDIGLNQTISMSRLLPLEKKLIVFGEDWGRFPSSTQYLITGLLHLGWKIIWINSIGMRKPRLSWSYLKRLYGKICQFLPQKKTQEKQRIPKNMIVVNPLVLPWYGNSFIDAINGFLLQKQLARFMDEKHFKQALVWTSLPTAYPYLKQFQNQPIIYYCCDEFSVFDDVDPDTITRLENQLIHASQQIIVSSEKLAQKMPAEKTMLLEHGVNVQHFQKHAHRPHDLPKSKPIAGFFGSLASWVDIKLLEECAKRLPHWNFVLIGPKAVNIDKLLALKNVYYLGIKPYQKLPAYPEHWDVSLLPFKQNEFSQACNPMQLKEYLACGKPIVCIDIPPLEPFKSNLYVANNEEDFIHGIELAQHDKHHEHRRNSVKHLAWENKAELLDKKLLELI